MLKKLKAKFILATVLSLIIVFAIIIGTINVINYKIVVSEADGTLQLIMDNKGRFPNILGFIRPGIDVNITPESPFESRYFTVVFENDKLKSVNTSSIAAINDEDAVKMANTVLSYKSTKGFLGNYRFLRTTKGEQTSIIFLDCTKALNSANTFLILSISISFLGILAVSLLVLIISERIVRPINEGYEKQKRFITDAGHDIKTPITIIDADAELIEMEIGENEWLSDIKKQTARMTSLTNDLIYLTRMEERELAPHIEFPLSEVAEEVVNSFLSLAKTKDISFNCSITPAIFYNGDEESIRKLLTLLIDNAVKYSPSKERIDIIVKKHGRGVNIKVTNVATNLSNESLEHIFDRFYRYDRARSSAGGFGIGLSVAQAIVSSHRGKISAHKEEHLLTIEVVLL